MGWELVPGLEGKYSFIVEKRHLANEVGSGMVSVLSTAMMVAGMEAAAVKAVQERLPAGKTTVGVHLDVYHKKSTPMNMRVRFQAILLEISPGGNSLIFDLRAFDEKELIGEGRHRRVVVDKEIFEQGARQEGEK